VYSVQWTPSAGWPWDMMLSKISVVSQSFLSH
jgi:hypothetical protein